ncbi:glucosaminidase domain-containing protein [Arenibaculum sp.]|uniref:glucosaminidase domain-containing protein n=1 Tax=Arenibaculum sp. TaxID=2865862 RepID=UPI002E128992|nr:glucosaminidase domain-containing protein [Arenibaculum sp.]
MGHPLGWRRVCAAGAAAFVLGAGTGAWLKWSAPASSDAPAAVVVAVAPPPVPHRAAPVQAVPVEAVPLQATTTQPPPRALSLALHAGAGGMCSLDAVKAADLAAALAPRLVATLVPLRRPAPERRPPPDMALWPGGVGACDRDEARTANAAHLLDRPAAPAPIPLRAPLHEPAAPEPAPLAPPVPALPLVALELVDIGSCRLASTVPPSWSRLPEPLPPPDFAPSYALLAAAAAAAVEPSPAAPGNAPSSDEPPPGPTLDSVLEAAAAQVAALDEAERQARRAAPRPEPVPLPVPEAEMAEAEMAQAPEAPASPLPEPPLPDIAEPEAFPETVRHAVRIDPRRIDEASDLGLPVPRQLVERLPLDIESAGSIEERKMRFLAAVLPLVLHVNEEVEADRRRLEQLAQAARNGLAHGYRDAAWLTQLAERYRAPEAAGGAEVDFDGLLRRVDVVPPSLALAQAAEESGWGRSRFARNGNALFGQITLGEDGLMPRGGRPGRDYRIRVFDRLLDSVRSYVHNLNTHWAYTGLRAARAAQRADGRYPDGLTLASGLLKYSERGPAYVANVQAIIRGNLLYRLDGARLHGEEPALWTYLPAGTRG